MANTNIGALSVKITADTHGVTRGINNVQRQLTKSEKKLQRNAKEWQQWSGKAQLATAALGASVGVAAYKVVKYADTFTSITNKLKLATDGTEQLKIVTDELFESSNRTGSSVDATAELYAKMERATRDLGVSQDRLLSITESVNKSFSISGASTAEASGAIRQLGQALASGVLRGDEFNSIAEQAPLIMEAISKATGKSAGELRKLAADGAITADVLIESLERYKDKIDGDYSTAQKTYAQKMEIAANNAIKFVGENDKATATVDTFGDALISLSENLDTIANVVGVVLIAAVGKYTGSIVAATATQYALATAQTTTITTSAILTKSTTGYGFATKSATAGVTGLAVATRGLSSAMAFLGGPVGILAASALALAVFVDWESDAEKQAKKTTKEINDQTDAIDGLSKANLGLAKVKLAEQQASLAIEIAKTNAELKDSEENLILVSTSTKHAASGMHTYSQKVFEATQKLKLLKKQGAALEELSFKIMTQEDDDFNSSDKKQKAKIDLDEKAAAAAKLKADAKAVKAKAKSDAAKLAAQQLSDAEYVEQMADRFKSARQLEIDRFNDETEILKRTYGDSNQLTEQQLEIEKNRAMEHRAALEKIKSDGDPIELMKVQSIGILEVLGLRYVDENALLVEKLANEAAILKADYDLKKMSQDEYLALKLENENQAAMAKRQIELRERAQTQKNVSAGFAMLIGQSKKAQKAMQAIAVVNAVIKGKEAAVSAFAAGMSTGGPWAPIVAASYAAASIANTASQIQSIRSGGKSSGGGGGGGAVSTPSAAPAPAVATSASASRNIGINFSGNGLMNSDQVRELIQQINEQVGDGVELTTIG